MKSGTITYYMKIPIKVIYSAHRAERPSLEYEGCPAHVTVDCVSVPKELEIYELLQKQADEIKEACLEDSKEG